MSRDVSENRQRVRARWTWTERCMLAFYLFITCLLTEVLYFYNQAERGWKQICMVVLCWFALGLSSMNPCHITFISFFTAVLSEYSWWATYTIRKVNILLGKLPDTIVLLNMTGDSIAGSKLSNGSYFVARLGLSDLDDLENLDHVIPFVEDYDTMLNRYRGYHGTRYSDLLHAVFKPVYRPRLPSFAVHISYDVAAPLLMLSVPTILFVITLIHLRRKTVLALRVADLTVALQERNTDLATCRIKLPAARDLIIKQQRIKQIYRQQVTTAVEDNKPINLVQYLVEQVKKIDHQISLSTAEEEHLDHMISELRYQIDTIEEELAAIRT